MQVHIVGDMSQSGADKAGFVFQQELVKGFRFFLSSIGVGLCGLLLMYGLSLLKWW